MLACLVVNFLVFHFWIIPWWSKFDNQWWSDLDLNLIVINFRKYVFDNIEFIMLMFCE